MLSSNESFLMIFCDEEEYLWEGFIYNNNDWISI